MSKPLTAKRYEVNDFKDIALHSGIYLFGPGSRPNATIARAVSSCPETVPKPKQRASSEANGETLSDGAVVSQKTKLQPGHLFASNGASAKMIAPLRSFPYAETIEKLARQAATQVENILLGR